MEQNLNSDLLQHEIDACIQDCLNCHTVCIDVGIASLYNGLRHASYLHTMQDCSEICLTTAHFMLRNSSSYAALCSICADICRCCASICETIGQLDSAEACRACALSCWRLAKHTL